MQAALKKSGIDVADKLVLEALYACQAVHDYADPKDWPRLLADIKTMTSREELARLISSLLPHSVLF